ncbi:hypothetical protein Y032_0022g500 [Ancylostoma ceylanicum]|uniref:Uncharacterized protein n=1 Tax=Ancylostoma ceylanicum TaxID=53326 RepID=A0A016UYV0_9BILA|nr:hypothetical protein Y032_0022g500 [Ancylostoma ceylanicum]
MLRAPYTFEADSGSDHDECMFHIYLYLRSNLDEKLLHRDSPGLPLLAGGYRTTDSLQLAPGGALPPLHPIFQIIVCLKS